MKLEKRTFGTPCNYCIFLYLSQVNVADAKIGDRGRGQVTRSFFPFFPTSSIYKVFYLTNTLNRKRKRCPCPQRSNYWKLSLNSWNIQCIFGGKILPLVLVSR